MVQIASSSYYAMTYARGVSDHSRHLPEYTPRFGTELSAPAGAAGSPILPSLAGTEAAIVLVAPRVSTSPLASATDSFGICSTGGASLHGSPYLLPEGGYDAGSEAPTVGCGKAELPTRFATACGISCMQRSAVDDRMSPEAGNEP